MNGAGLEDAVEGDVQLRAVGHEHRNPVARINPLLIQQGGKTITQVVQFGVAELMAIKMNGGFIR